MTMLLEPARRPAELNPVAVETLSGKQTVIWTGAAGIVFHLAYLSAATAWLIVLYLFCLIQLSRARTYRTAFYAGFGVGILIAAGRLDFFWHIFSAGAIALWTVYAFWIGLFVMLVKISLQRFSSAVSIVIIPVLWCGLEYFRSELYYLKFSWLSPGLAFGLQPEAVPLRFLGAYGVGMVFTCIACGATWASKASSVRGMAVLMGGIVAVRLLGWTADLGAASGPATELRVAGVQLEFPSENEVVTWLNALVRKHPEADLLVLSEYTFAETVPNEIKDWCRAHRKYLVAGGKDQATARSFYNTAFVISPEGEVVFRQAKSVPIQFFDDGKPASSQKVWNSPWGKIGICICYDLSYTRVTDALIRSGAELLIVPTMDVASWGKRQHELHGRIGPIRATEYHTPIFRLASSGISQAIDSSGRVIASAPFPGPGSMLAAGLSLRDSSRLPLDRWLAPLATALAGLLMLTMLVKRALPVQRRAPC